MKRKKTINRDVVGGTLIIGPELKHYGVKGMKWRVKKVSGSNEDAAGGGAADPDEETEDEDSSSDKPTLPSDRYRVKKGNKRPVGREKQVGSGKVTIHKREKANTGGPQSSKFANKPKRPVGRKKVVGSGKATIHKRGKANTGGPESSKIQSKWR